MSKNFRFCLLYIYFQVELEGLSRSLQLEKIYSLVCDRIYNTGFKQPNFQILISQNTFIYNITVNLN